MKDFVKMCATIGGMKDYVQGGGGNTSVKLEGGLMAIKASGYCLKDIQVDKAYAVLDCAALREFYFGSQPADFEDVEKAGSDKAKASVQVVEGMAQLRPSVEAGFHSLLDTYVAHSHSVYANLAACAEDGREVVAEALAGADYTWGFVPYVDPGARLTFSIRDELKRAGDREEAVAAAGLAVKVDKVPHFSGIFAGRLHIVVLDESGAEAFFVLDFHAVKNAAVAVEADEKLVVFRQTFHFIKIITHCFSPD